MDGDADPGQLNSADTDDVENDAVTASDASVEADDTESTDADSSDDAGTSDDSVVSDDPAVSEPEVAPTRLSTRWIAAVAAALVVLAGGFGVGGYLALQAHQRSVAISQAESQAVQAAKDCVAATQAPDPDAMAASQQKIYDCLTGDYAVQAGLMVGVLADAYRVAQAKVEVNNLRAAVEQHLPDGTVQVLVAVQVKITNSQDEAIQGYRLRVFMQPVDGTYKISRLDQVSS